jgi:hypothetical protein
MQRPGKDGVYPIPVCNVFLLSAVHHLGRVQSGPSFGCISPA